MQSKARNQKSEGNPKPEIRNDCHLDSDGIIEVGDYFDSRSGSSDDLRHRLGLRTETLWGLGFWSVLQISGFALSGFFHAPSDTISAPCPSPSSSRTTRSAWR